MNWLIGRWSWVSDASSSLQRGRRLQTTCHWACVCVAAVCGDQLLTHKENTKSEGHEDKTTLTRTQWRWAAGRVGAPLCLGYTRGAEWVVRPRLISPSESQSVCHKVLWLTEGGQFCAKVTRALGACEGEHMSRHGCPFCLQGVGKNGHPTVRDCVYTRLNTTDTFWQLNFLCFALPSLSLNFGLTAKLPLKAHTNGKHEADSFMQAFEKKNNPRITQKSLSL